MLSAPTCPLVSTFFIFVCLVQLQCIVSNRGGEIIVVYACEFLRKCFRKDKFDYIIISNFFTIRSDRFAASPLPPAPRRHAESLCVEAWLSYLL